MNCKECIHNFRDSCRPEPPCNYAPNEGIQEKINALRHILQKRHYNEYIGEHPCHKCAGYIDKGYVSWCRIYDCSVEKDHHCKSWRKIK